MAKPDNSAAKIGPVHFEITGLIGIFKNKYKIRNSSRTYGPQACL